MTRPEKGFGERSNDDIIREILREHASRENPIGRKEIIKHVIAMGYVKGKDKSGKDKSKIERKAIEGFVDRMGARVYETEEECDEIIRECRVTEREVIFIKKGQEGRTIGYWMMETLSDTEWMFLMDSVLNSKILTKKEADNLANRITFLAGKLDELKLPAVLTIENSDQKVAKAVIENTNTKDQKILTLNSMQSVTTKDVEEGTTYLSIMENNLQILKEAL